MFNSALQRKYQEYLERRIGALIAEGLTDVQILQRLETSFGKKIVLEEIKKERQHERNTAAG